MQNYNKALDNGNGGPDEISDQQIKFLVQKFQRKGFDAMSLEEVATAMIIPNFSKVFNKHTGLDWTGKFEVKAHERLNRARFDISWMTRTSNQEHNVLFMNCLRGDLPRVRQYLKECKDVNVKTCVDESKKTPLHVSCIEGHLTIVEMLLLSGFNPNARDRTLKTPLHYACLHGHDMIADTLLKAGSDILARDSLGRSAIHFAACGSSAQLVQLLLASKPELASDLDHKRRCPLHYCVWNSSQNLIDILRTLLDFKASPIALDEELKTPIHHASEGGKTRAIPILLQRGGQEAIQMRDKNQKTPLELAANDRTREVLIVYSSSPLNHNGDDLKYLELQGKPLKQQKPKAEEVIKSEIQQSPIIKKEFPVVEKQTLVVAKPQQNWAPASINSWIREKFFSIMKKVQEAGIAANHHLKRPYVYTGSWMEGVNTMEELYASVKDIPAGEAIVRTFNILCPFDRQLPSNTGQDVVDGFYGELWFDGSLQLKTEQLEEQRRKMQQEYLSRITDLETLIHVKDKQLFDTDLELTQAKAQLEVQSRSIKANETKVQAQIEGLQKQLKQKDDACTKFSNDAQKLQQKVKDYESQLDELRNQPQGVPEEELEGYMTEISNLKSQLQEQISKEKTNRSKAGQLFLKTLESTKIKSEETRSNLKSQIANMEIELKKKASVTAKTPTPTGVQQFMQQQLPPEQLKLAAALILPTNAVGGLDNLQDDDAIIELLRALKGNPPPMKQRMKVFDKDLDGKLDQEEFKQFLTSMKLNQQSVLSLCRIGGFLGGRKLMGIDEWAIMLQERPKQREQFEQALFNKLLDAIKSRGLTIERMFELIDSDGSGSLSPSELKEGLKALKIILNQKDLNNMFCIFDSDKSGSIQLAEMKDTLENYEKLRGDLHESQVVDEEDRIKAEDEDNPFETIVPADTLGTQESIYQVDPNDLTPIAGQIKVQLVNGTAQPKSILAVLSLRGCTKVTRHFIPFGSYQQAIILPIQSSLKENLSDFIWIQLYQLELKEENFIGDIRVPWKGILEQPNQWVINNKYDLKNTTYIKEASKMFKAVGNLNIQCKWIPLPASDIQPVIVPPTIPMTIAEQGVLEIIVVQCILEKDLKGIPEAKYLCDLRFMKINQTLRGKLTAQDDVYFESKFLQDLICIANEQAPSVSVRMYYEKPKNILQSTTVEIGNCNIDWTECIQYPGEYLTQKSFKMSNSKFYMKMRYIPQSMFQQMVGFRDGVSNSEKKRELTLEDMQTGTLKILFVRGRNLRADDGDTSDPYCIAKLQSFDKVVKLQSKTIKSSLNPDWRDLQSVQVTIPKEAPFPPLEIEVFDEDRMGDDSLGTCKIDIAAAVMKPCTWAVNEYFKVIDPKCTTGEVYIQVYWVPPKTKDPNIKPKDKDDSSGCTDPDPNFIDGTMMIKVVHARELPGQVDPYALVYFPSNKELKTDSISCTSNPVFNQTLTYSFKVPKDKLSVPIKILVKDSNILSDTMIGYCDVKWDDCISKPGEWAINQVFNLSAAPGAKFGSVGFIYLQGKFLERGMIDDQAEAPLVENLLEILNQKQGLHRGTLRVFLVHARNLVAADDKTSDPYVVFKVPGGKKLESMSKKETLAPSWKTIYNIDVAMPKDSIQPMRVEVYDDDMLADDLIGYCVIDLSACFASPQQWKFNEVVSLSGDLKMQEKYKTKEFGKIYLQIMFCLQGIQNTDQPLPLTEDLDEILREQILENKKPMKGQLFINIPLALALKIGDEISSDPYCKITFPDNHVVKSKSIEKTINPVFNFEYKWNCNIIKEQYADLKLQIYDADALSDDILGSITVPWMECFNNPCQWMINKLYSLDTEGQVYVQMKFLLAGQETTVEGQRACDTLQDLKQDYGRVIGKVSVKIVSAASLYNADITGKSDPFVECYLSSESLTKMKTPIKENTLDPKWDFEGVLTIDLLRCQVQQNTIHFDVKDDDEVGSDFLGSVDIDLIEILEKNPGSVQKQDYPLKDDSKKGNPNLGTLRIELVWLPDPRNEGVVGLRQPPKMYQGDLCVRFPSARQLPKGDPFIEFSLTGDLDKVFKCKHIESQQNPDFNYEEIIPIDITERRLQSEKIKAKVINYNLAWKNTTVGGIIVSLLDIVRKPGTWFNQYLQLYDDDGKKIESYLYCQIQFRDESVKDKQLPVVIDFQKLINANKPPTFSGKFKFTYIGLKALRNMDLTGLSDPFVEIKMKGVKTSFKTSTQDDKTDCFWKDCGEYEYKDLLKEDLELKLYITVYDYDYTSNDVLGTCEVDCSAMKSGQWLNATYALFDEKQFPLKSEIYIQCQYICDDSPLQPQPVNLWEQLALQQAQEAERIRKEKEAAAAVPKVPGVLRVFANYARNLKKADTFGQSDPFIEFKISRCSKTILKSNTIDDNPNPDWNYSGEFLLAEQEQEYKGLTLMATVYDYDTLVSSDFLGFVEIQLDALFSSPGQWLNQIYQLKDEHGTEGQNGTIYLSIQWVPDNKKANISLQKPDEPKQAQQVQPVVTQVAPQIEKSGILFISIVKILNYDKKSMVKVKCTNPKVSEQNFTSNLVQPGVDYSLKCLFDVKLIDAFKIEIQLTDDTVLASLQLDVAQIISQPGTWINDAFNFTQSNLPANVQLLLQAQYRTKDGKVNTQEPPLKEIIPQQVQQTVFQPKGKLKIAVIRATGIILLDNGKTSNTKITLSFNDHEASTDTIQGTAPEFKKILDFPCNFLKIEDVKQLNVKVFHNPGILKKCILIGEVNVDITQIYHQTNQWAIKNDYLLTGVVNKQQATGSVTLQLGFVSEKEKDMLIKI